MILDLPASWHTALASEFEQPYWDTLVEFVKYEYLHKKCFPEWNNIFRAFDVTLFDEVRVVILGQDPYHTDYAAMGLSFSIPDGTKAQPSLKNIFKELESDTGIKRTKTDLTDWAVQGVFLLNSVLTVREGEPTSHQKIGWENFTDSVISMLSSQREGIVFILWGNYALTKKSLIDESRHHIITSPHPSPFSAHRGFFGSRPFSRTNHYLIEQGTRGVRWG